MLSNTYKTQCPISQPNLLSVAILGVLENTHLAKLILFYTVTSEAVKWWEKRGVVKKQEGKNKRFYFGA